MKFERSTHTRARSPIETEAGQGPRAAEHAPAVPGAEGDEIPRRLVSCDQQQERDDQQRVIFAGCIVDCESTPERTTFRVLLPIFEEVATGARPGAKVSQ